MTQLGSAVMHSQNDCESSFTIFALLLPQGFNKHLIVVKILLFLWIDGSGIFNLHVKLIIFDVFDAVIVEEILYKCGIALIWCYLTIDFYNVHTANAFTIFTGSNVWLRWKLCNGNAVTGATLFFFSRNKSRFKYLQEFKGIPTSFFATFHTLSASVSSYYFLTQLCDWSHTLMERKFQIVYYSNKFMNRSELEMREIIW